MSQRNHTIGTWQPNDKGSTTARRQLLRSWLNCRGATILPVQDRGSIPSTGKGNALVQNEALAQKIKSIKKGHSK